MTVAEIDRLLADALVDRHLLTHPFYRRWEAGQVTTEELAHYAAQYRHFEAALPAFLAELEVGLPDGPARRLVAANLADERGDPVPHLELFDRFVDAVGATAEPPAPATRALLATYAELLAEGAVPALAGFVAYESQAAEVAASKAAGLRSHYRFDGAGVSFWEHHADVDGRHGDWLRHALGELLEVGDGVPEGTRRAADAWWAFLDEREAAAA
ncbi:MAG: iron-containing redox enzyme family protein [Acidimicrobiales bacterium]